MTSAETTLREGLKALALEVSEADIQKMMTYASLLIRWNKTFNLTAVRDINDVVTHHLLDSAALIPLFRQLAPNAKRVLDVGSGGGLPSIILAILCPEVTVHAVDAVQKKTVFLTQCAIELGLPNFRAHHKRVETLQDRYDVVTSRAFASLKNFTDWSRNTVAEDGQWLAMKGVYPEEEIQALDPERVHVERVLTMTVPFLTEERHLVVMTQR